MSNLTAPSGAIVTHSDEPKPPVQETPGYLSLVRSGASLPVNNWSRQFRTVLSSVPSVVKTHVVVHSDGSIWYPKEMVGNVGMCSFNDMSFIEPPPSMVSALKAKAIDAAKNGAWDVGTFALEADKTYKLVSKASDRTRKRMDRILDKKVGKVKTLQEFSDAWMEYRYGWRILSYDLESAQDSVTRFLHQYQLNRAYAEESLTETETATSPYWELRGHSGSYSAGFNEFYTNTSTSYRRTTKVRVGCGVLVDTQAAFTINPVMTAWELTPWSFILDWFVDVGTHIGAYTPTVGRTLDHLWMTTIRECEATSSIDPVARPRNRYADNVLTEVKRGNTTVKWTKFDRQAVTPDPFSVPRFKPNLSFPKFVDLAAIALSKQRAIRRILRV